MKFKEAEKNLLENRLSIQKITADDLQNFHHFKKVMRQAGIIEEESEDDWEEERNDYDDEDLEEEEEYEETDSEEEDEEEDLSDYGEESDEEEQKTIKRHIKVVKATPEKPKPRRQSMRKENLKQH